MADGVDGMSFDTADLLPLLPFLLPGALLAYMLIVPLGGTALRLRRKRRARNEAARYAKDCPPWNRWLDEINRGLNDKEKPGATEKWRE